MNDFLNDAVLRIDELVQSGEDPTDATRKVVAELHAVIMLDAETVAFRRWKRSKKNEWAEPQERPNQMRLNYNGAEFAIADTPVRVVIDEEETFKPAQFSTGVERVDSCNARIHHHQSIIRRAESESLREERQIAMAFDLGLDMANTPFHQLKHQTEGTSCWRCGLGWRAGDPFERGHSDRPESQGGSVTEWEHRSCNRSSKDNPVARADLL